MLKFSVVLLGVERVIFIVFIVSIFQSSPRRRLDQPHRGAGHPDLVSSGTVPAPAKNIVTRGERAWHEDDILPQRAVPGHNLANWSPDASLRVSALPQVILLKPLPSVLKSCVGLHHGEVGGKLEDVLGEALLGDSSTAFLWHFTQPVCVSSLVAASRLPDDLLLRPDLPLRGDHLWEVEEPGVGPERRGSSLPATKRRILTTNGAWGSRVLVCWAPIRVASEDPTAASKARSLSRCCPRVRVGGTSVPALVKLSCVWVVQIGHRSEAFELVANASSVRLVGQPRFGRPHPKTTVGVAHFGLRHDDMAGQLLN